MANARYYLSIFMRRLPYFMIVAAVISAASVILAIALPPAYVSQMQLIVEAPQIAGDTTSGVASEEQRRASPCGTPSTRAEAACRTIYTTHTDSYAGRIL